MELFDKVFFEKLLGEQSQFCYAHLPKPEQKGRKPELLSEHSALTIAYAYSLAQANGLDCIIENLVNNSIPKTFTHRQLLVRTMKTWFWRAIAFHDLGKINHLFQKNRMKNEAQLLQVKHSFESQHSVISAYLYLALFFSEFLTLELSEEEQVFLANILLYMSGAIRQHHGTCLEESQNEERWCDRENGECICRKDIENLKPYLSCIQSHLSEDDILKFHVFFLGNSNNGMLFGLFNEEVFETKLGFPLFALIKLLYSVLTTSDYMATAHYMNNWVEMQQDYGVISTELRQRIIRNVRSTKIYNKQTFSDIDSNSIIVPNDYTERNGKNLNILRKCLAIDVVRNTRRNHDKRLFYIEAPTGGGKTNASMLALSELLEYNPDLHKVFYVFPFTTLISQTYHNLKDTLGLLDDEIIEFHSKASKTTGKYEDDYLNYMDCLFLNIPIVLLSHVSFFDVLKTNQKENNYLLQRIAHSVVIIDEIQSYPPSIWDKIVYFIDNYAEYFDMRFIVMSATLPQIGDLIENKSVGDKFVYLVNDKNSYFQNPNFGNRVTFDYSLLDLYKPDKDHLEEYLKTLSEIVFEKSMSYAEHNENNPNSVFTIVEFIFKKTASLFTEIVKSNNACFDEILLLSGTVIEPRRKQIIQMLKPKISRTKKILLVTTQVVEAGVDIDMDLGFKDTSLIDSDEQLAGRINRNADKQDCKLYLFDCNTEKSLYGGDERYIIMQSLRVDDYHEILDKKNFGLLYQKVINRIKKKNQSKFIVNMQDLYRDVAHLDFKAVDQSFEIIKQNNITVFIPLSIKIELFDEQFVKIADEFGIISDDSISGWDVWRKYEEVILSQDNYIINIIMLNKIRALASLFTFSVFPNSKDADILKTYGREEYGYLFLESYSEIYSFENGINTRMFNESKYL